MILQVYNKSGIQIASTGNFTYSAAAMGEKNISVTVESPIKIPFTPLCYVTFKDESYYLQSEPSVKRVAKSGSTGDALQYNLTFKSKQTDLVNCDFQDYILGSDVYFSGMSEFGFFGDVYDLARRIQANLNIEYPANSWTVKMPCAGYADPQPVSSIGVSQRSLSSESKQITVSDENCWNALTRAYSDFGFNFYLDTTNRIIFIGVTYPTLSAGGQDIVFTYGSGKGLYEINRNIEDTGLVTRLRAYGSEKNIPTGYMSSGKRIVTRLQLPSYRQTLSNPVPTDYILADPSLIDYYGIRPGKQIFDDIYPTIKDVTDANGHPIDSIFAVESITDGVDENGDYIQPSFWVYLYDMGFDITQLQTSEQPVLSMISGLCAAIDFAVVEAKAVAQPEAGADDPDFYNQGVRWKYRLEKNTSYSSNYILPSGNMLVAPGDSFVLLNISMPDNYVIAAEQRLLTAAQEYLAENCRSKISYSVNLDEIYLANNPLIAQVLAEGRNVKIIDNDLGDMTDDGGLTHYTVRSIQGLTIRYQTSSLLPTYNITLSESLVAGLIDRIQNEVKHTSENVNQTIIQNSIDRRNAVRNTRNLRALKNYTYDPDGYFDTTRLKPLSIETLYLSVGGKSGNFSTNGVKTKTFNDGAYKINITSGFINHREIWWTPVPEEGQDPLDPLLRPDSGSERYSWAINSATTFTMTDDTKPYYVFARCSQISGLGDWLVTTEQKSYKDATYFYFEFGSIEVPSEGRRDLVPTKGAFFVSGGQIYGDRISSISGNTYFDLDSGVIQGFIKFIAQDGMTIKDLNQLTASDIGADIFGSAAQALTDAVNYANGLKAQTDADIDDVEASVSNLDAYVDGAFHDGVISEAEAKKIQGYINTLNSEKADVDNRYTSVYNNTDLSGTPKSNLSTAKTAYDTAHTNLILAINTAIADGATTPAESAAVDTAFSNYSTTLATLSTRFEEAINFIAYVKAQSALTDANGYTDEMAAAKLDAVINGKTLIIGGYLNTQFIEAASILADMINVNNLAVKHVKTASQTSERIWINRTTNASGNPITPTNAIEIFEEGQNDDATPVIKIDDTAGSEVSEYGTGTYPGIEVRKNTVSKLSSIGIFTNGSGMQCVPSTLGITAKAAITALANGNVSDANGFLAALYAHASNSGSSPAYAAYLNGDVWTTGKFRYNNFDYDYYSLSASTNYEIDTDKNCLILMPAADSGVYKILNADGSTPTNGKPLFVVNASLTYSIRIKANGSVTGGNIRANGDDNWYIEPGTSAFGLYYSSYWRIQMDYGQ